MDKGSCCPQDGTCRPRYRRSLSAPLYIDTEKEGLHHIRTLCRDRILLHIPHNIHHVCHLFHVRVLPRSKYHRLFLAGRFLQVLFSARSEPLGIRGYDSKPCMSHLHVRLHYRDQEEVHKVSVLIQSLQTVKKTSPLSERSFAVSML